MQSSKFLAAALLLAAATASGKPVNDSNQLAPENPFTHESTLPYRLPPLDKIKDEHFKPALLAGMAGQRKEIDAIAKNSAAPTFENTIVAMERSGELLTRVTAVFGNLSASNTNPQLEALQTEMSPKLSAHSDAIYLDSALYGRVRTLYEQRASLKLDPESLRLLERYNTNFVRAGARLSEADKTQLKQLNEQISKLTTEFRQTVLKGVNAAAIVVDSRAELDGMTDEQIAVAAETAKQRNLEGKWVIALLNTTTQPALAQLENRALRERIYRASIDRGWGGEFDTTSEIAQIVKLRAERAALLGYSSHAAYVLEDETALNAGAVNSMLSQLAPPAVANAKREAADIQALIDAQAKADGTASFKLEPWDWDFYAEQVRRARYSYDESEVRPYFEMNRVLVDGVLFAAHELYGLSFKERKDLPKYQEDVRVFEVLDSDGSPHGLFLVDWYARSNKRGGAWMNSFVEQSRLLGADVVLQDGDAVRLWLAAGAFDIEAEGDGDYDRTLQYWTAELLLGGELVSDSIEPLYLGLRADGVRTDDDDEGYLLDMRFASRFGFNMTSLENYSVVAGWRLNEHVTIKAQYTFSDVDITSGAGDAVAGHDEMDFLAIAVSANF